VGVGVGVGGGGEGVCVNALKHVACKGRLGNCWQK
jgi:hypothetical protein